MQNVSSSARIWFSDYGDIYLKRIQDRIQLKRYTPLDNDYMNEYCADNVDVFAEWQEDVANWNTEDWYESYRDSYEYDYDAYFSWDSDNEEWYDWEADDMTWDYIDTRNHTKQEVIDMVLETFDENYYYWNFQWESGLTREALASMVAQLYDNCEEYAKDIEESKKPHWNVFSYYK